jgi:hypothetical protein
MKRPHVQVPVRSLDAPVRFYSQPVATMAAWRPQAFIRVCK